MRRAAVYTVVWIAAAAVAVTAAWQGVNLVTDQVTDERPAPLTAADVEALTAEGSVVTSTTTGATATTTPSPSSGSGATTTTTRPVGPPTSTTAAPSVAPPTTTTTAPAAPAPAETRTYTVVGGSVALRFSPTGVTVVWANPNAGFEVEIEPEHGNGVKVEFESESHRSRVDGWWDGGPRDEVREDGDDSGED